jgi:polyhydroxybutyrate depolymerase
MTSGSTSHGSGGSTDGGASDDSSTGSTGGSAGSSGCGNTPPDPGTHTGLSVDVNGQARSYDLFVPTGYAPDVPAPLVLNFHGLYQSPPDQADFSQFDTTAESRGILVAYPEGIGQSFNAGACCGEASSSGVDDVAFARALVEQIENDMCVDPRRVYATGMSNGGHMAHTLGCQAADVFAAVAPVAGVMGLAPAECVPSRPVPVLDFHGDVDMIVPYGGAGPGFPAVPNMMADWAARNGCAAESEVILDQGDVTCEAWPGCSSDVSVVLCTVAGGGHCWPGGGSCLFGSKTDDVDASDMIADFFADHVLP